jgi:23S rRNA (uridine2552-2'-O)-methyltransferase
MSKRPSSKRWLRRQQTDEYVRRAQAEGWRSRAVFKLMEMQERYRLLRPGQRVLDLGAAPGAWSQFAAGIVGSRGRVFAVDILPMDPIPGVEMIRGDFRDEQTLQRVLSAVGAERSLDLVMSDMAPNISGNRSVDQPRAMYLTELASDLAGQTLKPGGAFVAKLFHGEGFDDFVRDARASFGVVRVRKPKASRPQSRETYLVATGFRL